MIQTFYPYEYEVQFWRGLGFGCLPCKTLKEAKQKAKKYAAGGDEWQITKRSDPTQYSGVIVAKSGGLDNVLKGVQNA